MVSLYLREIQVDLNISQRNSVATWIHSFGWLLKLLSCKKTKLAPGRGFMMVKPRMLQFSPSTILLADVMGI